MEQKTEYTLQLSRWTNHAKEWAAKITGLDPKYGFQRVFMPVVARDWARSGKTGTTTVQLDGPGFYEISDPKTGEYGHQARKFFKLTESYEWLPCTQNEIKLAFGLDSVTINVNGSD